MGTNILVPGADFSASAVGFNAAVTEDLEGVFFFNRGARASARNLAAGKADCQIIGAPVEFANFLRFTSGSHFLQTDISDTVEFTHILAYKSDDEFDVPANQPMMLSNFGSGSAAGYPASGISGASIYIQNSTNLTTTGSRLTSAGAVTSAGRQLGTAGHGSFKLWASRVRQDRAQEDNLTAVTAIAGNYPVEQSRVLGAGKFRIGSSYSAQFLGVSDIAAVVMYSRYIDDAELAVMAGQVRNVLDHLGIAV